MENNYLDRRVREALEGLEAPFQADSWEQMESLLNNTANADLSENQLDHDLRQKLSEVRPEFQASHWDMMETQLNTEIDSPEIEDVFLDGVTYELLNEFEVPYNSDHWAIMQRRLEEEFSIRRKLVRYKVAELALLALALFTVLQFLPLDQISTFRLPFVKKTIKQQTPAAAPAQAIITTPPSNNNTVLDLATSQPAETSITAIQESDLTDNNQTEINDQSLIADATLLPDNNLALGSNAESKTVTATNKRLSPQPLDLVEAIPATIIVTNNQDQITPLSSINKRLQSPGILEETELLEKTNSSLAALEKHIQNIPTIQGLSVELLSSDTPDLLPHCVDCDVWKRPSYLRFGMVGTADLNYVMTAYNDEYFQRGYSRFEPGYGAGLTLGFKFGGSWELEAGASYNSVYYNPDTINYTINQGELQIGYEGHGWSGTQLELLRIPLRARYDFTKKSKWHFYAQGGVALNVAMQRIHSKDVYRIGKKLAPVRSDLRGENENTSGEREIIHTNINESVGLFTEDGTFADNHFYSADLGFGLERFLSPRFSVFAQPLAHFQISKNNLGLIGERINRLSLEAGVRVSLKKLSPESH